MRLNKELTLKSLELLNNHIESAGLEVVHLVVGGGSAMLLGFDFGGVTLDVDAVPVGGHTNFEEIRSMSEQVAVTLGLNHDWLNPYFQSFTIYLPADTKTRMKRVFTGSHLIVDSLGAEDIMIMKLMAGRQKDIPHLNHLLKLEPDLEIVRSRLEELIDKSLYKKSAEQALDLLDELTEHL